VIDEGKIVEKGTHTELLHKKGYYAEMYARQQDHEAGVENIDTRDPG
jgi:ABC-type multidrug transport system fused ATPase/permease subunit